MGYKRIDMEERMEIFRLYYKEGMKRSEIALALKRNPSSIGKEIAKGTNNKGEYNPVLSNDKSILARKVQVPQLKMTEAAWKLVRKKLERHWSPEQIEKRLKKEYPMHGMSAKTIYNYIHIHMKGELKKLALKDLRLKGKKRKNAESEEKRGKIPNMTLISERPPEIEDRNVVGHWEGDLIMGDGNKSAILVLTERSMRYVQLDLLRDRHDAFTVRNTIEKRFKRMRKDLVKSLTLDQGKENSQHPALSENLKIAVYFCHPASPWEKGTCENTNYLIRDMSDGVSDFRLLSQKDVSKIAMLLNERPRKTLDFKSPMEIFLNLP
jgi:IS30 family transposase